MSLFRWIDCTDKRRPQHVGRPEGVKLRLAHMTDPHVPGDIPLGRRLRDLVRVHRSPHNFSHEIMAISNELSQPYRKKRKVYTNLLKKALMGLRQLDVDHLLLTGDLAHCGMAAEFLEMKAILSITGWSDSSRVTIIPGNHDRFNLYESIPNEPMEAFFDVVSSKAPRIKKLPKGVALFEVDSNSDRADDRHYMERWLPNTMGRIYPETVEALAAQAHEIEGRRLLVLIHHHLSTDWYPRKATRDIGGLMGPVQGLENLMEVARSIDPHALILHGHIHDVMPLGYTYEEDHFVSNPGGFAESLRVNLLDLDRHAEVTMTQVELRE